jgi:hypothetical protein
MVPEQLPLMPVEEAIRQRRSTRNYDSGRPISFEAFSTLLVQSARGFATDYVDATAAPLHDQ